MSARTARWKERQEYDPEDPAKQHAPKTSSELLSSFLDKKITSGLSQTSKAFAKWCEVAGKRAIKHTKAVWLNTQTSQKYPELTVYIDTSSLLADYTTNADLYIDRFEYVDFPISKLFFKLSNKVTPSLKLQDSEVQQVEEVLPELSEQEEKEVENLCSAFPEQLKTSASRAMKLSLKRQKLQDSGNNQPRA